MVGHVDFTKEVQKTHDANLKAGADEARRAAQTARLLLRGLIQAHDHGLRVTEAVLGQRSGKARQTKVTTIPEVMESMDREARRILRSGPMSLTVRQIKMHHEHVSAMIRIAKQNISLAKKFSEQLIVMREHLEAILALYP